MLQYVTDVGGTLHRSCKVKNRSSGFLAMLAGTISWRANGMQSVGRGFGGALV